MGGSNKTTSSARRVSGTAPKVTTPPSTSRPSKSSKQSKIIQMKLSSTLLAQFPHEKSARKPSQLKSSSTSTPTPAASNEKPGPVEIKPEIKTSPAPSPPELSTTPLADSNQKVLAGPKAGIKRELGEGVDDNSKSKSRPGPKKKQKLDNGVADGNSAGKATSGLASVSTHKLGPKANQGAINAGLRALDRSGTPCRKWAKRGLCVKTFTGVTWQINSWRAPKKQKAALEGEAGQPILPMSNSQSKENNSDSINGSRSSPHESTVIASSPIPAILIPA